MPRHPFAPLRGTIVTLYIESTALEGNLLGDPTQRAVPVYLPEGYDSSDADYPLLVDLVGFTGSGFSHIGWRAFHENVPTRVERLIAEGRMGPAIVAFPDCFTSLGGNQYINSAAMGRWEDFLIEEMLPRLESELRLRKGREHRGVFGKSSGGYGAIVHGLRRADAWNAVACHSGDMGFDWVYRVDLVKMLQVLQRHENSVEKFLAHLEAAPKIKSDEMHALMSLAMSATYDPDPAAFKGVNPPVDLHTGELDSDKWARWLVHDPLELVRQPACQDNLRKLAGLYVDCGTRDQYSLLYGARPFVRALEAADIAHRYEEFEDDHSGIDYRMDVSLPYLYAAITGGGG